MRLRVGTSGYDFDEWVGSFYPEDLAKDARLAHYASQFDTVELNATFYRSPKSAVVSNWAAQVDAPFTFALKASRRITHQAPLTDFVALDYFCKAASHLGDRMGPILFQITPYFRRDTGRLAAFLEALPQELRAVFEFRNPSWNDPAVLDLLRDAGAAWCIHDRVRGPARDVVATTNWGYARLQRPDYTDAELADWARRLAAPDWEELFVFFKHDLDTAGPGLVRRFLNCAAG